LTNKVAHDLYFFTLRIDHRVFTGDAESSIALWAPRIDSSEQKLPLHQIAGWITLQLGLNILR
jgi:hypothetical protein